MPEIISIDEIEDGLVLAEPIINSFGQTMLGQGVTLRLKHKNLLKTWKVEKISIKTVDDDDDLKISNDLRDLAKEQFSIRCKWSPRNPFEKEIVNIGVLNIADRMSQIEQKGQEN